MENNRLLRERALELAEVASQDGDTLHVADYIERVVDGTARSAGWRLTADALLAAGDSSRALAGFRGLLGTSSGSRRAIAATEVGLLLRAAGDTATARALLLGALDDAPTRTAGRAAAALMNDVEVDPPLALRLARILDRAGDGRRALRAYDVAAADDAAALPEWARLSRARLMGTVRSRQDAAAEEFRAIRVTTQDASIGARNLEIWAAMRRRQGRTDAVSTLRRWLLELGVRIRYGISGAMPLKATASGMLATSVTPTRRREGLFRKTAAQISITKPILMK